MNGNVFRFLYCWAVRLKACIVWLAWVVGLYEFIVARPSNSQAAQSRFHVMHRAVNVMNLGSGRVVVVVRERGWVASVFALDAMSSRLSAFLQFGQIVSPSVLGTKYSLLQRGQVQRWRGMRDGLVRRRLCSVIFRLTSAGVCFRVKTACP
jgi:hypothetical protein